MWSWRGRRKEPSPREVQEIGRSTWELLHAIAKFYPAQPTQRERDAAAQLFSALEVLYPCRRCAAVLALAGDAAAVDTTSGAAFALSLCRLHNFVNRQLGKPEVECAAGGKVGSARSFIARWWGGADS